MAMLNSIPFFYILLALLWNPSEGINDLNDDVMSCALCTIVVEAMMVGRNPGRALALAYRRCGKMGLMEPLCDQMIERNAKKLLEISDELGNPTAICVSLQMCGQ